MSESIRREISCLKNDISSVTTLVDRSSIAKYSLVGQNGNQENIPADLTTVLREDIGISAFVNNIGGDYVEISAMGTYDYDEADGNQTAEQRVSPIFKLQKQAIGVGAFVNVAISATGYQRHTTGHNDSSNTTFWMDESPSNGDVYRLLYKQGSTQVGPMLITQGHLSIKVVEKITVLIP